MNPGFDELVFDNRKSYHLFEEFRLPKFYADVIARWLNGTIEKPEELQIALNILILNPKYQLPKPKIPEFIALVNDILSQSSSQDPTNTQKGLNLYSQFYYLLKSGQKSEAINVLSELEKTLMHYILSAINVLPGLYEHSPHVFNVSLEEPKSQDKPDQIMNAYFEIISRILDCDELIDLYPNFNLTMLPLPANNLSDHECYELRGQAFDFYQNKLYNKALETYRLILVNGYEIPGTLTHMARVELCLGQVDQAQFHIELAWRQREEAPEYVMGRILWFKLCFQILKNFKDQIPETLDQLLSMHQNRNAIMNWRMDQVLATLKPMLNKTEYEFLSVLTEALSFNEKFEP
jgi:hypothetical protein